MSDENAPPEEEEADEAWLATFADLMSLLMCFFVLLLSFSEMDLDKYRQIAGSLKKAFGVQRQVSAPEPPKGVSVIAQEFSPGIPSPTQIKVMQQLTKPDNYDRFKKEQKATMEALRKALSHEITHKRVDVLKIDDEIIVRIRENESFESGSATLRPSIKPILKSIVDALADTQGRLVVGGHTDNVPIATTTYPSNWVLSAARAANVVHYLATTDQLIEKQIELRAYGETRPIRENDTAESRAINRRVEIIIAPPTVSTALNPLANNTGAATADDIAGTDSQAPVAAAALPEPQGETPTGGTPADVGSQTQ